MAIYSNRIVISVSKAEATLNITNSQSIPTQTGLQVMWQVPVSTLQTRILLLNNNLSNLRFVYNGQFVPAWLESINNGTATIWIKMPVSIPANSSITLNLYANPGLNFDGVYWGEAPQLSPTYGQYDNGASVFNNYWNFVGTTLPSNLNTILNGGSINVNNSITLIPPIDGAVDVYYSQTITTPAIIETLTTSYSNCDASIFFSNTDITSTPSTAVNIYNGYIGGYTAYGMTQLLWKNVNGKYYLLATGGTTTYPAILSLIWGGNGNIKIIYNYTSSLSSNDTTFSVGNNWLIGLTTYYHGTSPYVNYQWFRLRTYLPNGVMPTVELM
jgi:hypothetical protein